MLFKIIGMTRLENNGKQIASVLFIDSLHFVPRVGDIIHTRTCGPYEVIQVIIRNSDIILEVKECNNPEAPLVTTLASI